MRRTLGWHQSPMGDAKTGAVLFDLPGVQGGCFPSKRPHLDSYYGAYYAVSRLAYGLRPEGDQCEETPRRRSRDGL